MAFAKIRARRDKRKNKKSANQSFNSGGQKKTTEEKMMIVNGVLGGLFGSGGVMGLASNFMPKKQKAINTSDVDYSEQVEEYQKPAERIDEIASNYVPLYDDLKETLKNSKETTANTTSITNKLPLIGGIVGGVILLLLTIFAFKKRK